MRAALRLTLGALALTGLAACSDDDAAKLPGERIPIRALESAGQEEGVKVSRPLPPVDETGAWTHAGGNAAHSGGRREGPAGAPALVWSANVPDAPGALLPPTGPVVHDGRIFVRDGASGVLAFEARSGRRLWQADLTIEDEDGDDGYGGGLAIDEQGRLFATTGFGEVVALDPATGEIRWRARGTAPYRGAPVATQGQVAAVNGANMAIGYDAATGEESWRREGLSTRRGNLGRGAPGAAPGAVLAPFGSGELAVIRIPSGVQVWSINLAAGGLGGEGLAAFSDVTSGPALMGGLLIAGTAGGPIRGIDGRRGAQVWSRNFGSVSTAWVAGDTAYIVTTEPRILRIQGPTGATLWSRKLQGFEDEEDREDPITWTGPVLAGDMVWTTSTDGRLAAFDGVTGAPGPVVRMPGGSVTGPIAAGGMIYVLTDEGRLLAYR